MHNTEFRCPRCNGELVSNLLLKCCDCQSTFDIKDGIIDFRCARTDHYFSPIPRTKMLSMISRMTINTWEQFIRALSENVNQNFDLLYSLIADGRYAWKILLDLKPDSVALNFGSGFGSLSYNIAPHVAKEYFMDLTWEHLEFIKKRFTTFHPDDKITLIAGGDSEYLPFPDNSIDCVFLCGLLEQVSAISEARSREQNTLKRLGEILVPSHKKSHPYTIQLAFLQEVHRILKPEGQLFMTAENRLNYEYFTALPDCHSRLKYGILLLRFFSNVYSIMCKRSPSRTYTYSMFGYTKLFRKAGFEKVDFFSLLFDHGRLNKIFPLFADVPYWLPHRPSSLKEKVKQNKYLVPTYGIIGNSSKGVRRCILDQLLTQITQALRGRGYEGTIALTDYSVTDKDKGIITGIINDQEIIIKLPFSKQAIHEEQQNVHALRQAHNYVSTEVPFWPESFTYGESNGVYYFVEERIIGEPLKNILIKKGRTTYLHTVEDILEKMNPGFSKKTKRRLANAFYDGEVNQRLEKLFYFIPDKRTREKLSRYFYDLLYGMEVCVGVFHGDFSVSNIICMKNNECKVIDWAGFSLSEIIILDALYYLNSVHRWCTPGSSLLQPIKLLAATQWPIPEEEHFFLRQCKRWRIDKSDRKALAYLYWLRHVTTGIPYYLFYGQFGIKTKIQEFVDYVIAAN